MTLYWKIKSLLGISQAWATPNWSPLVWEYPPPPTSLTDPSWITKLFSLIIIQQEREAYFEQELQQAVQRLEEQFYEFESLPEHVTREQLTSIIRSIGINKAAVTNASISQKIQQIQDLLEFKYKRGNVDNETVDKDGKKSAKSGSRSGRKWTLSTWK